MATTGIGLIGPITPSVDVLRLDSGDNAGESFMVIRLGEDATVIGPGLGREQVAYARALAAALLEAAAVIELRLGDVTSEGVSSAD